MSAPNRITRLDHRSYTPGRWAGGATRGIWAAPPEAIASPAAAHCWAGTATIEQNAPYSYFAGRHRLQLLIGGAELRLRLREPDEEVVLTRGAQHQFDGERPVEATPMGGPVVAFNLIYRADVIATATVATLGPAELTWPHDAPGEAGAQGERIPIRLVYAIAGAVAVGGIGPAAFLHADDAMVLAPPLQTAAAPVFTSAGPGPAELILATFWLLANTGT